MKKIVVGVLISIIASLSVIGCSGNSAVSNNTASDNAVSGDSSVSNGTVKHTQDEIVFSVEGYDVTAREFNLYLIQTLSGYQVQSAQMSDEMKMEFINGTKDEIRLQIIVEKLANEKGTTLDETTLSQIDEYVYMFNTYYGDTILKAYGIDEDMVRTYFTRIATVTTYEKNEEEVYKADYIKQVEDEIKSSQFCSFAVVTFGTEEDAKKFKDSMSKGKNYQDILSEVSNYSNCELKDDKGIYGGFDEAVNNAVDGLKDGEFSDVITYEGKPAVIFMKNSADEEFYNQTVDYIVSETAKQLYAESVDNYIKEKNIPDAVIDDSMLVCINPEIVYSILLDVETYKQQQQ